MMKCSIKAFLFFVCFATAISVQAQSEKIKKNAEDCSKISALAKGDREAVARDQKVSMSSIRFIESGWFYIPMFGSNGCAVKFDTPKGPVTCQVVNLYRDNQDVWASLSPYGNALCH